MRSLVLGKYHKRQECLQSYFHILTIVKLNYIGNSKNISKYQMKVLKLHKPRLHLPLTVNLQCSIILLNKQFYVEISRVLYSHFLYPRAFK